MPHATRGSVITTDGERRVEVPVMWPTRDMPPDRGEQLRWHIRCTDSAGDDRWVTVLVMGDRVAVVLPPAEILVFDPDEAEACAALLIRAAGYAGTAN
jgi:hypothetical protein